jgi:heme A synthase
MTRTVRALRGVATAGTALAGLVLAASAWLRLNTVFDLTDRSVSLLAPAAQDTVRMVHRLSASAVGALVLLVVVLALAGGAWRRRVLAPVLVSVAATVVLALIGPLTPGYVHDWVTQVNVLAGVGLLLSFWWLRETLLTPPAPVPGRDPIASLGLVAYAVQFSLGAWSSALALHSSHGARLWHMGFALGAVALVGASLRQSAAQGASCGRVGFACSVLALQCMMGLTMAAAPSPVLGLLHALGTPLLGMCLVSLAVRRAKHAPTS